MVAQRVRDHCAWWLFSELARRAPHVRLRGGGSESSDPAVAQMHNLEQLLLALDHSSEEYSIVQSVLSAENPKDAITRWAGKVGAHASPSGPMQSHVLVYRLLTEALARNLMGDRRVRARWAPPTLVEFSLETGFVYSPGSSYEWGPFAGAAEHVHNRAHQFALGQDPLASCWVLTVEHRPLVLLDEGGWAHDALGNHTNLARIHSSTKSLSGTYERALAALLD